MKIFKKISHYFSKCVYHIEDPLFLFRKFSIRYFKFRNRFCVCGAFLVCGFWMNNLNNLQKKKTLLKFEIRKIRNSFSNIFEFIKFYFNFWILKSGFLTEIETKAFLFSFRISKRKSIQNFPNWFFLQFSSFRNNCFFFVGIFNVLVCVDFLISTFA